MKTILILSLALAGGERPASAPPIDKRLTGLEDRVANLETRVDLLEGGSTTCNCAVTGVCTCPADKCACPNCPTHRKTVQGAGMKLLGFKTSWCAHCPGAEKDCEGLPVEWLDADSDPRAKEYNVTAYPALIRLVNGKKDGHFEGRTGMAAKAREWLMITTEEPAKSDEKPAETSKVITAPSKGVTRYGGTTWTWPGNLRSHLESEHGIDTSGLSDGELRTVHDNLHNTGRSGISGTASRTRTVRYSQPVYYQPRTYYRPSYGSYCPSCVR